MALKVSRFEGSRLLISYKFLTNFLQISYKFLTNFLQISYKFLTNFLQITDLQISTLMNTM
jgi:hypothetical protein